MKCLLISTNRESKPSYAVPKALSTLQGALENKGHIVRTLDLCFEEASSYVSPLITKIKTYSPELIGISIRNVDNETFLNYRQNVEDAKRVVQACKENSVAPIIVGGAGFSLMPQSMMRELNVEYGIVGEGEEAILRFVECIEADKELTPINVPGLIKIKNNKISFLETARVSNLDHLFYSPNFVPDERYFNTQVVGPQPSYGIQTKRGCGFRCVYCSVPAMEGKKFRLIPEDIIIEEMERVIRELKVNKFFFTDSIINIPYRHIRNICEKLINKQVDCKWMAYANPLKFDFELADLMKKSGCFILNFGLDAACEEMLKSMQKDFSVESIIEATRVVKKAGIKVVHSLLLGGPGETPTTVKKTLDTMGLVKPDILTIAFGIRLYPQAPIWEQVFTSSLKEQPDPIDPLFYVNNNLTTQELEQIASVIQDFIKMNPDINTKMHFDPINIGKSKDVHKRASGC